jgi:uncharacterized GH25 family protein
MSRFFAAVVTLLTCSVAAAHDFWIEPSTFRTAAGRNFTASLLVGQDFAGDPVARSTQLIDTFTIRDAAGERPVAGFEGQDPAGILRIDAPGIAIIGYHSKPWPLELAADKFEEFLRTEELDDIRALRAKRGETQKPDRERFFRFAKAIVRTNDAPSTSPVKLAQPFGWRYELIPESDPMTNAPLKLRVLFEGKPLANALVVAMQRDDPSATKMKARTDRAGRLTFTLPKGGVWMLKSVKMVPAPAPGGAQSAPGAPVDWESLWASLTFER